ncbi:MAG: hypothetical protein Q8K30_02140 [Candidatus Gracilibacteria bacterium]|nr:hypothetical protein [Candidatus Gracilibacteria bacterium]
MKKYLFLTHFDENAKFDLESTSGVAIVEGENSKKAFDSLLKESDYIGYSGDIESYICYELVNGQAKHFKVQDGEVL